MLPLPEIQIIGGGAHANWWLDVQDFMIVPIDAARYEDAMEIAHNVYRSTRDLLRPARKAARNRLHDGDIGTIRVESFTSEGEAFAVDQRVSRHTTVIALRSLKDQKFNLTAN